MTENLSRINPNGEQNNLPENPVKNRRKKVNKKLRSNLIIVSILIVLWAGIVYSGYIYAKNYLDTAIAGIRQENAVNLKYVREDIALLTTEIQNLRTSLEATGTVLSGTSDVQSRIDQKLVSLEKQLKELEKSLEILKEAPNAKN